MCVRCNKCSELLSPDTNGDIKIHDFIKVLYFFGYNKNQQKMTQINTDLNSSGN